MTAVKKLNAHLTSIQAPAEIASRPIWLIWRFETVAGETKPRKVSYYATGGRRYGVQGRPEDRQKMVTLEAARAAAARRGFDGVGLAPMDGDFTVMDFDDCLVDGVLPQEIETMAAGTYAEYSPSGKGIHIFVQGNMTGNNKSMSSADQFGLEAFSTKGFVTFTGNALEITQLTGSEDTIAAPGPELTSLVRLRFGNIEDSFSHTAGNQQPLGVSRETIIEALDVLDNDLHYDHWLMVGMAIHHETGGEGFDLWDEWSQRSPKYTTEEYGKGKWESFGRNPTRQVTIRSLIQLANQSGAHITVGVTSLEEFEDLTPSTAGDEDFGPSMQHSTQYKFEVIPWDKFATTTNQSYLIKGLLPQSALGVIFGESGSGKSFIALDLAAAIARGTTWRGRRTTPGRVVYLVAEGAAGFRNRLKAYASHFNLDPKTIPLGIIDASPNLLLKDDVLEVCKAILGSGPKPSLVIIDTLAQAMAGANENASDDMGKALAHCKGIHKATGAMVLLIHHSGKDSTKGARGWSGLRAAADVEIEVSRTSLGRVLRTTKQKDGADFQEFGFNLEVVTLGFDQDGDKLTSCVAVESSVPVKEKTLGDREQAIINAILSISSTKKSGISQKEIVDMAMQDFVDDPHQSQRRKNLNSTFKNLSGKDNGVFHLAYDGTITATC